ncbi:MAG: SRPBCC family protein [Flavobacteriales bacterium]|nr:SRPBCC family protein [Flavobacteriales bacterium]
MRALKTLLIILTSVVVLVLVLGFLVGPRTTVVQRSITIEAGDDLVWPHIASLRALHAWGVWKDMDKDQRTSWEGEDGTVGSTQRWEGDTVGTGMQTITAVEPGKRLETELRFIEPWETVSQVDLDLESADAGSNVTWRMTIKNGFMGRLFGVFMDMDKMIGPDFERGLANLKALAESEQQRADAERAARTFRGYEIEIVDLPRRVYIGKRAVVKWADMQKHAQASMEAAGAAITAAGLELDGPYSHVYFLWDEKNQRTDHMPGLPVKAPADTKLPGLDTHVVEASKALRLEMVGGYGQLGEAHTAIDEMLSNRELVHLGNVIEEYVVAAPAEPDSSKWVTVILYQIR